MTDYSYPWVVKTPDGMKWRFDETKDAFAFYDELKKSGENPSFPAFLPRLK
jgi:hypothetical protein